MVLSAMHTDGHLISVFSTPDTSLFEHCMGERLQVVQLCQPKEVAGRYGRSWPLSVRIRRDFGEQWGAGGDAGECGFEVPHLAGDAPPLPPDYPLWPRLQLPQHHGPSDESRRRQAAQGLTLPHVQRTHSRQGAASRSNPHHPFYQCMSRHVFPKYLG
jgi:hypothetical protein